MTLPSPHRPASPWDPITWPSCFLSSCFPPLGSQDDLSKGHVTCHVLPHRKTFHWLPAPLEQVQIPSHCARLSISQALHTWAHLWTLAGANLFCSRAPVFWIRPPIPDVRVKSPFLFLEQHVRPCHPDMSLCSKLAMFSPLTWDKKFKALIHTVC